MRQRKSPTTARPDPQTADPVAPDPVPVPDGTHAPRRAMFAGIGAGASLIAGAVIAFLALTGLLSFEGLIPGDSAPGGESVFVAQPDAPEAIAANLATAGADGVAGAPVPVPVPGAGAGGAGPAALTGVPALDGPSPAPTPGPTPGPGPGPPADPGPLPPPQGPIGGVLDNVPPVGGVVAPITQPLDDTLTQVLRGDGLTIKDVLDLVTDTLGAVPPTVSNLQKALLGEGPIIGGTRR